MSNAGTLSCASYGALVLKSAVSLTNAASGTITSTTTAVGVGAGIGGDAGGSMGNAGSISGRFGVLLLNAPGSATNSGIIRATGKFTGQQSDTVGEGIQLRSGGTITNQAGGTISGYWIGAQIGNFGVDNPAGGAVLNAGTITANDPGVSGAAVCFKGNGLISNAATGTIAGDQFAVFTSAQGQGNRIIVYPGAGFAGTVLGDKAGVATPTGVLELAAGGSGTIVGFGTSFQSFGRVQVDAGATWSLGGTVANGHGGDGRLRLRQHATAVALLRDGPGDGEPARLRADAGAADPRGRGASAGGRGRTGIDVAAGGAGTRTLGAGRTFGAGAAALGGRPAGAGLCAAGADRGGGSRPPGSAARCRAGGAAARGCVRGTAPCARFGAR